MSIIPSAFDHVPVGTITAFTGNVIPDGWAVCDGSQGTADLRSKFINNGQLGSGPISQIYIQKMFEDCKKIDNLDEYIDLI